MKKFSKKFAVLLIFSLLVACIFGMQAFAEEIDVPVVPDFPEELGEHMLSGGVWNTVYTKGSEIKNLAVYNDTGLYVDIRMLGANGGVVWGEDNNIPPWGTNYYYLGSDVRTVQLCGYGRVEVWLTS